MSTRITNGMMSARVLSDLNAVNDRLTKTQSKIASNREIERASDDPFAASRAMALRQELGGIEQYQRNIEDARGWQDAAESAMNELTGIVHRARDLLIQAASDTTDATARASIRSEVLELVASAKDFANTSYKGQYLFSGVRTDVAPYADGDTPASDVFQGQAGTIARQIGPGVSVEVNVDLQKVLGNGQSAGDDGLLDVLRDIAGHLEAGDGNALRDSDIARLDANLESLLGARALNGARSNRLDAALGRLGDLEQATTTQLSETEDVDIAKAMIDFSSQQAAYQAALKAAANIVQPSLMDFLR